MRAGKEETIFEEEMNMLCKEYETTGPRGVIDILQTYPTKEDPISSSPIAHQAHQLLLTGSNGHTIEWEEADRTGLTNLIMDVGPAELVAGICCMCVIGTTNWRSLFDLLAPVYSENDKPAWNSPSYPPGVIAGFFDCLAWRFKQATPVYRRAVPELGNSPAGLIWGSLASPLLDSLELHDNDGEWTRKRILNVIGDFVVGPADEQDMRTASIQGMFIGLAQSFPVGQDSRAPSDFVAQIISQMFNRWSGRMSVRGQLMMANLMCEKLATLSP